MFELTITRKLVSLRDPDGALETTRALVGVTVEDGRPGIVSVGETESLMLQRLRAERRARAERPPSQLARGLTRKLFSVAQRRIDAEEGDAAPPEPRVLQPGEEPFYDRFWREPPSLLERGVSVPELVPSIVLLEPLAAETWAPHLGSGILQYVLATHPGTQDRLWPAFRRPTLTLRVASDFDPLEYEEIVDALGALWGARRLELPAERPPVGAAPVTALVKRYQLARLGWWAGLAVMILAARPGKPADPGPVAVAAGAFAVVSYLLSRHLRARSALERRRTR